MEVLDGKKTNKQGSAVDLDSGKRLKTKSYLSPDEIDDRDEADRQARRKSAYSTMYQQRQAAMKDKEDAKTVGTTATNASDSVSHSIVVYF